MIHPGQTIDEVLLRETTKDLASNQGGSVKLVTPNIGLLDHIAHNLAQYPPFFPIAHYTSPPKGCVITQVRKLYYLSIAPFLFIF